MKLGENTSLCLIFLPAAIAKRLLALAMHWRSLVAGCVAVQDVPIFNEVKKRGREPDGRKSRGCYQKVR